MPVDDIAQYPLIVVGSGFYGLTVAEQVASILDLPVLVIDRRNHIGGNAYSEFDKETGIEIHKYGTHIFHTSNEKVWEYVNRFTSFTPYIHKVKINSGDKVYSMPINLHTINQYLNKALSPGEAKLWIENNMSEVDAKNIVNLEQKAISLIGKPLYETFIKGYTQKQWQTDPKELPGDIISRLPVRLNYDDSYFNDPYQGLPTDGYMAWINNMIKNPKIKVLTGIDFFDIKDQILPSQQILYTGPIDRYFNYQHGVLGWRTLDFEVEKPEVNDFQGTSVMNYADVEVPFTRIHEFKHLHPERTYNEGKTVIMKEFSRFGTATDEPYYPINTEADKKMLHEYRELAKNEANVTFGGRLGRYQYLDMHMAISSALQAAEKIIEDLKASAK